MEEGQLKKRIVAQSNNGLSPEEKDGDINSEDLLQWLDEAKKEWLEIEECELPMKINGQVDWQKTAELMELRNIIRNRWFKKWFGGEKE
jgi:hypothetical protein